MDYFSQHILKNFLKFIFIWCFCGVSGCNQSTEIIHNPTLPHTLWPSSFDTRSVQKPCATPLTENALFDETFPHFLQKSLSKSWEASTHSSHLFKTLASEHCLNIVYEGATDLCLADAYTCYEKPLGEILRDLCTLLKLRIRLEKNTLYIQKDLPYVYTHSLAFLTGTRRARNQTNVLTNVLGSFEGGAPNNHSNTNLSNEVGADFWAELEHVLTFILSKPLSHHCIEEPHKKLESSKQHSSILQNRTVSDSDTNSLSGSSLGKRSVRLLTTLPLDRKKKMIQKPSIDSPLMLDRHERIKEKPSTDAPPYALHKQAGLLSVRGTYQQHLLIHRYLHALKKMIHAQVTIEAQILEVLLKKNFSKGIDWRFLGQHLNLRATSQENSDRPLLNLGFHTDSLSCVIQALSQFGQVRTLSNPRLTVLNNHVALMKVAKNEVFFQLEVDRVLSSDNKPDLETTTSRMQTIPIGLVLVVHPCVDPDTEEITLALRPTLSRVVEMRDDPSVSLRSDNRIHSQVPVVQMREVDSVVSLKSHEVILMGGLMEQHHNGSHSTIPGIGSLPVIGDLFSGHDDQTILSELVILLKVWIEK